ncbi:MAG: alpha/beta hydrolase [Mycobacterium sp.]
MAARRPSGATIPEVTHCSVPVNGTTLHYVSAGKKGSPILLLHGWPETWWAFRKLIPLLAQNHRVFAADLRGYGDSSADGVDFSETTHAEDIHQLVDMLDAGPVHLLCQDISGGLAFRFAVTHPESVMSFIAVETTLAGFGLESLTDVNHGGSWHNSFLAAPGIPEMLLAGHEREFVGGWALPMMTVVDDAISDEDIDEFVRSYARPNGWRGTAGLYQAIFTDNGMTRTLVQTYPLSMPVLAVDGANAPITAETFRRIAATDIDAVVVEGVGHLVAQEAPGQLAAAMEKFIRPIDASQAGDSNT